jgi:hypothetical protein
MIDRRKFLVTGLTGAGLLGAGGAIGYLATRQRQSKRAPLDERFFYDVTEFQKIDPALIVFAEQERIPTGFADVSCLAIGQDDALYVGGDRQVKAVRGGSFSVSLPGQPNCVTQGADGRLYVGLKNYFEVFDATGKSVVQSDRLGDRVYITALAQSGETVAVADAGNREVVLCGLDGKVKGRFGRPGVAAEGQSFVVPSPYFDLLFGSDGMLWVVNPGRHLVQAYTPDGQYQTGWGETAITIEGFCGCCNPVHLARMPDGRFITSEKGLNRIKMFSANGKFLGVVAGPEQLLKDVDQANRGNTDQNNVLVYDIACDSRGRVLVLDPHTRDVRVFTEKKKATA